MGRCVFCAIVAGREPASVVYVADAIIAFLDIRPVNPGHLLVVPRVHAPRLADLDAGLGAQMFVAGQRLALVLRTAGPRCDGVNLFLADGAAAGQDVPHVHLHVVPRVAGDGFRIQPGSLQPDRAELDATAARLRQSLSDPSS